MRISLRHLPRAVRVAGAALVSVVLLAAVATAQRIPERLADSTFWRMVTEFSEPSGFFSSDNFVSNETELQYVIPPLLSTVKPGGVYLGVGPEQNFTYIVAFQPRIAFICDIRRQNMIEHLMYKALIELSADRADLLSRLWARPRPRGLGAKSTAEELVASFSGTSGDSVLFKSTLAALLQQLVRQHKFALDADDSTSLRFVYGEFFRAGPNLSYTTRVPAGLDIQTFAMGGLWGMPTFGQLMPLDDGDHVRRGWLSNEANFQALKDFETRNLLVPIVGNFGGDKALRSVARYLKQQSATASVFYLSNVEQYLFQQGDMWKRFYANVAALPTDSASVFIRSLSTNYAGSILGRNPGSRMTQLSIPIDSLMRAIRAGRITSYYDVIVLHRPATQ